MVRKGKELDLGYVYWCMLFWHDKWLQDIMLSVMELRPAMTKMWNSRILQPYDMLYISVNLFQMLYCNNPRILSLHCNAICSLKTNLRYPLSAVTHQGCSFLTITKYVLYCDIPKMLCLYCNVLKTLFISCKTTKMLLLSHSKDALPLLQCTKYVLSLLYNTWKETLALIQETKNGFLHF